MSAARLILISGFLSGLISAWPPDVLAQGYNSVRNTFQVDEVKGCVNFTTTIILQPTPANGNCTVFNIIPGDGGLERQNTQPCTYSYTYTRTGQFWLKVRTQGGANNTDSIRITVEPDIQPEFQINSCNGSAVQVRITDRNYDQYFIDFDYADPVFTTDTAMATSLDPRGTYRYGGPGSFTVAVQGKDVQSARNCTPKTKTFEAVDVLPTAPPLDMRVISESAVEVDFDTRNNIPYRLDIGVNTSSAFQQLRNLNPGTGGPRTETLADLNTSANHYCVRLRTVDACASTAEAGTPICSIRLNLSVENDVNRLSWSTSTPDIQVFSIRRNGTDPFAGTSQLRYDDTDLTCDTDYCYQVTATYIGGARSRSIERCGRSRTSRIPPALQNIASVCTPDGSRVELKWTEPENSEPDTWLVHRSDEGRPFQTVATSGQPGHEGELDISRIPPSFRISYVDRCRVSSPNSGSFKPIVLTGLLEDDNSIRLGWGRYRGYAGGPLPDSVFKFDSQGQLLRKYRTSDSTWMDQELDTVNQVVSYRIKANAATSDVPASYSNVVTITREPRLFFPTAFTPDGNGLNEGFRVYGQYLKRIRLQIFDRWGTLLFTSDSNEGAGIRTWNGKGPDDQPVPQSVYVWKALITDFTGKDFLRTGSLALIRK